MATPDIVGFYGMRGTGDWSTDERPESYRQKILQLYPNGQMPLTGITSKIGTESVDDPQYHWWEEVLPTQGASFTAGSVYSDAGLSTALTTSSASDVGTIRYVKVAENEAKHFRAGHDVILRKTSGTSPDKRAKVVDVTLNGSSSFLSVKMVDADSASSTNISTADYIKVIGNVNAEGATRPDSITYDPIKRTSYTQIFRTPIEITRTAMKTRLRTEDALKKEWRHALMLHGIEMEKAFIWNGAPSEGVGANGKPERRTGGIIKWIQTYAPSNNVGTFSGTWLTDGQDWLDGYLKDIFRYGNNRKLALCGTGALQALNKIASTYGTISLTPQSRGYGLAVREWITPFGTLDLMTHPLFSHDDAENKSMLIIEPERIMARPLKDSDTKRVMAKTDSDLIDGTIGEYITEIGLEIHQAETMGYLRNLSVS